MTIILKFPLESNSFYTVAGYDILLFHRELYFLIYTRVTGTLDHEGEMLLGRRVPYIRRTLLPLLSIRSLQVATTRRVRLDCGTASRYGISQGSSATLVSFSQQCFVLIYSN